MWDKSRNSVKIGNENNTKFNGAALYMFLALSVFLADIAIRKYFFILFLFILFIIIIKALNSNHLGNLIKISIRDGAYVFLPFRGLWISKISYQISDIPPNKKINLYDWVTRFPKTELRLGYIVDVHSEKLIIEYSQFKRGYPVKIQIIKTRIETYLVERSIKFEPAERFPKYPKKISWFNSEFFPEIKSVLSHFRSTLAVAGEDLTTQSIFLEIKLQMDTKEQSVTFSVSGDCEKDLKFLKETVRSTFKNPHFYRKAKYQKNEPSEMRKIINLYYNPISISSSLLMSKNSNERDNGFIIGKKRKMNQVFPFQLNLKDFYQGGIITGAPGTGKTTLRLTIMKNFIDMGIKVMDFDLKGEAAKLPFLTTGGYVFVPKQNFHINVFLKPAGISDQDYINFLFTGFVDNFFNNEKLSSNQSQILYSAIRSTVLERGSPLTFFQNILWHGFRLERISDNHHVSSSFSLLTKFQWMETNLKEIFWVDRSSFNSTHFSSNIFFDFSHLALTAPFEMIRFLLDILILNFKIYLSNQSPIDYQDEFIRHAIFVDEAQILLPRKKGKLNQIEEAITTLRYKGVAVFASGTSSTLMSEVLLNSGFIAKFRGADSGFEALFGTNKQETELFPFLPNYSFLVKSKSTEFKTEIAETFPLPDKMVAKILSKNEEIKIPTLPEFEIDEIQLEFIKICAFFGISLPKSEDMKKIKGSKKSILMTLVGEIYHPKQLYALDEILHKQKTKKGHNDLYKIIFTLAIAFKSPEFLGSVPLKIKTEIEDNSQRILFANLKKFIEKSSEDQIDIIETNNNNDGHFPVLKNLE